MLKHIYVLLTGFGEGRTSGMGQDAARLIRKRLASVALGLLATLDSKAFSKYRTDFPTLLVKKPLAAYEILVETLKTRERARVVLRSAILPLAGSPLRALEAVKALEEGDEARFKEVLGLK